MDLSENAEPTGIEESLAVLRRRGWIIVLCIVVTALAAFGVSKLQTKEYTATASLLFTNTSVAQQASGLQPVSTNDPQGQRNTNLLLVQLAGGVSARTAKALGHGLTPSGVRSAVHASASPDSNIVSIAATSTDPRLAAQIANQFTQDFIREQQLNDQADVQSAINLVNEQYASLDTRQRAGSQGQVLQDHLESLRILKAMSNNTRVAQTASVPTVPSSPRVKRNTALGAVLGLLIGLAITLLVERLDRRLREPRDAEKAFGLPMLGLIPTRSPAEASPSSILGAVGLEPFRMLRAHLRYFNVDRELRTLLVTSAQPSEGKSTVASNLAAAATSMGTKTLLIEADLRKPSLARTLNLVPAAGIASVLVGQSTVEQAIQTVEVAASLTGTADSRQLDVLPAGAVPPNPSELVESRAMMDVLAWAREHYDLVVIDTPPVAVVADAIPLLEVVDGVIVVSRFGETTRDTLERLRDRLDQLSAPTLGVVVNDAPPRVSGQYGYGYGDYVSSNGDGPTRIGEQASA